MKLSHKANWTPFQAFWSAGCAFVGCVIMGIAAIFMTDPVVSVILIVLVVIMALLAGAEMEIGFSLRKLRAPQKRMVKIRDVRWDRERGAYAALGHEDELLVSLTGERWYIEELVLAEITNLNQVDLPERPFWKNNHE